jgi:AAA domain
MCQAGELLEAHVITSLTNKTKHLILIGDHKQLRPKVENYHLQVESRAGYCLNRSLLERLITQKPALPSVSLSVQHRMRPEICNLIRSTYSGLTDHHSVYNRPTIRGLAAGSSIVFWDHSHCEDNCACHSAGRYNSSTAQRGFGSSSSGSVDYASLADTGSNRKYSSSTCSRSAAYGGMYSYNVQQRQQRPPRYTVQQSASAAAAADTVIAQHSRSNSYEVDMCVATVKYLLLQGYKLSELVVLTPYLGQLRALERAFKRGSVCVLISELDEAAMIDTGIADDTASTNTGTTGTSTAANTAAARARAHVTRATRRPQSGLRVATVDGFQGEVSDVSSYKSSSHHPQSSLYGRIILLL